MSKIKAFKAIHPHSMNAAAVVNTIEEMSLTEAKAIRSENPQSFIHLLVPQMEDSSINRGKENVFRKIDRNLEDFLRHNILIQDQLQAIYIYHTILNNKEYIGVWNLTSVDDYANGKIKLHEHIRPEREKHLSEYREKTGIDANPVLLTYRFSPTVNQLVIQAIARQPFIVYKTKSEQVEVWKLDDPLMINKFVEAFANIDSVYIADGHHRAAAAFNIAASHRSQTRRTGEEDFDYFSTVYISDEQLTLASFNVLVDASARAIKDEFISKLKEEFLTSPLPANCRLEQQQIGLFYEGKWLLLQLKSDIAKSLKDTEYLSVFILHNRILKPLLDIDAETDSCLNFVNGLSGLGVLEEHVRSGSASVAFLLPPISIADFMKIADTGHILPPKSTYFEPKFPVGLLTYKFSL